MHFFPIFILQAGDIKLWTKKIPHSYFSCCDWNVNSLATDNYSKVLALKAYNSTYKYNFTCISETFLDSSFEPGNTDLVLDYYNLIWSDHPSNTKRGGVCIYYKESFAVHLVDITSLLECQACEVTKQNKKGYVAVMYRSPSQNSIELKICSVAYFSQNSNLLFFQVTSMPGHQHGGQMTLRTLMVP